MRRQKPARCLPAEAALLGALVVLVAGEISVTYARLPARELYHVSGSGVTGGASRAVVFLNFPAALMALSLLALLFELLPTPGRRFLAVVAAVLCCAVFWPGVVDQANLDAKPVNTLAALGVAITGLLALDLGRREGVCRLAAQRGDRLRVAVALALVLLALPWIAADLGFFLDGVPLVGSVFQTGAYRHGAPGLPPFPPAVHHGHHHGLDGVLLVLAALLLSRTLGRLQARRLRATLAAYLSLMLCYGVGNIANDFWLEQVVKRGWTGWEIPNVLEPRATVAWAAIAGAATVVWLGWRRPSRER
jgi:hypothetical protein